MRTLTLLLLLTVPCRADYVVCEVKDRDAKVAYITRELQQTDANYANFCLEFARRHVAIDRSSSPWQLGSPSWHDEQHARTGWRAFRDHWRALEVASAWIVHVVD